MTNIDEILNSIDISKLSAPPAASLSQDYSGMIQQAATEFGIPDRVPILEKMMNLESSGRPRARSPKGAMGLFQLMPGTARGLGVTDPYDPEQNIRGGVKYYSQMLQQFGGDDRLALAAYNAGPGTVRKYGGVPPFKETQEYVNRILGNTLEAQQRGVKYGFGAKTSSRGAVDCSGWVCEQLRAAGADVNDTAAGLAQMANTIGALSQDLSKIQPGSVLFLSNPQNPGHAKGRFGNIKHTAIVTEQDGRLFVSESKKGGIGLTPLDVWIRNRSKHSVIYNAPLAAYTGDNPIAAMVAGPAAPQVTWQVNPEKEQQIARAMPERKDQLDIIRRIAQEVVKEQEVIQSEKKRANISMPLQTSEDAPSMATQIAVGMVDDPQAKFKILAARRFPNEPPELAAKRYFIKDGEIFFIGEGDKIYREIPDNFVNSVKSFVSQDILGRAPEQIGSAAGFATLGVPGAMAGAGAGSILRQEMAERFLGDKPKGFIEQGATALGEAAMAGVGGVAGKGFTALANKGLLKSARPGIIGSLAAHEAPSLNQAQIQELIRLSRARGIELTAPEITNSPTLIAVWHRLAKSPGTPAEKIDKFLTEIRTPQIYRSIQDELGRISPEADVFASGSLARDAMQNIHEGLESARKAAAAPVYERAYQSGAQVDINPVMAEIKKLSEELGPNSPDMAALEKFRIMLLDDNGNPLTNLRQLHNVKENIDKGLSSATGELSVTRQLKRRLTAIKEQLREQMNQASPEYQQANRIFADYTKPINELLYGNRNLNPSDKRTKTLIARALERTSEQDIEKIPGMIMGGSKEGIKQTKKWFLDNGYQDEWYALVRGYLTIALGKIKDLETNRSGMYGANFKKLVFGTPDDMDKLKIALGPDKFSSFKEFMDLMHRTGKIVYTNSSTAHQLAVGDLLTQSIGGAKGTTIQLLDLWGKFHSLLSSPLRLSDELKTQWAVKNADIVLDALMNPANAIKLARIKRLPDTPKKAIEFMTLISGLAVKHNLEQPENVEIQR